MPCGFKFVIDQLPAYSAPVWSLSSHYNMDHLSQPQPASDVTVSNSDPDGHTAGSTEIDVRDNEYYFELVVFKVGNTIFRVPKNGLVVPGAIFEAMFSLPTTEGNAEGLNDQNPINLPVNEESFRGFLRAMYPFNGLQLKNTDWLGALELSTMWMFDEVRDLAIQALEPWIAGLSAKEVIILAKKYRVLKWLKSGYKHLLQQILSVSDLKAEPPLDWETIARLLSLKLLGLHHNSSELVTAIEQEFKEEFFGMT